MIDRQRRDQRKEMQKIAMSSTIEVLLDRVESKFPFVRQFGEKDFDSDRYIKDFISKNKGDTFKASLDKLDKGHKCMQKEIANFLQEQKNNFLSTADSLNQIHGEFEELRAMLN